MGNPEDISAMRKWPLAMRVDYMNALRKAVSHRCPRNKLNVPLVTDFDMLTADEGEKMEALKAVIP